MKRAAEPALASMRPHRAAKFDYDLKRSSLSGELLWGPQNWTAPKFGGLKNATAPKKGPPYFW